MNYILKILPSLISGLKTSLLIFGVTLVIAFPLSIAMAVFREESKGLLEKITYIYILVFRGTPLMLQLMFIFFMFPSLGINLGRMTCLLLSFILNYTAYFMEIIRGGLSSIDSNQYNSCLVLGLNKRQMYMEVLLPQALKNSLTAIVNESINLIKDTSLAYVVGIGELLRAGKIASNRDASLIAFIIVALIYLFLVLFITWISNRIEGRLVYE